MATNDAYLLDTSIASALFYEGHSRHNEFRTRLEQIADDVVFISAITVGEVEYGLNLYDLGSLVRNSIRDAMHKYKIYAIDHHTAQTYGEIRAVLFNTYAPRDRRNLIATKYVEDLRERTSGLNLGIQENDLWIVSVAKQYNLKFATADGGGGMRKIVEAAQYSHRTEFWQPMNQL